MNAELKALTAQMNPHFISNFLSSLHVYIDVIEDKKKLKEYVMKFSKLSRLVLEHSHKNTVSIFEDLEALKLYLDLEVIRTKQQFNYEIEYSKELDIYNLDTSPLVCQPFVENSIKHGILPSGRKGNLKIQIKSDKNRLIYTIEDNGVGINSKKKIFNESNSLSTTLTRKRLDILGEKYDLELPCTFENLSNVEGPGTRVIFAVPLLN